MIQNNKAIVVKINNVRKHSNADKLNCTDIFGYNVIIGLDVNVGDVGVYFPDGVQLSEEFCLKNNLLRIKNEDGTNSGGMFEETRRVKTLKLRGERSEGFWCPISHLSHFGDISILKDGECFDSFGGKEICHKYISTLTLRQMARSKCKQLKSESVMMPKHMDTEHLKQNIATIKVGDILHVSEKLHGTSFRVSRILEEISLKPWKKRLYSFINKFVPVNFFNWTEAHGSRNVVLGDNCEKLRNDARKVFLGKLHKGEAVYGEICGYDDLTPIVSTVDNTKLGKEFVAKYGDKTVWHYGTIPGQFRLAVYRITQTSEDGNQMEYSVSQIKRRCAQLGVDYVPDLSGPIVYDGNSDLLLKTVELYSSGQSTIAPHWKEGCVVRVDATNGRTFFLKEKNFEFKVLDGIIKESNVDLEDLS